MKAPKLVAALIISAACAAPVVAQTSSGSGGAGAAGSGASTTQATPATSPDTRTMGSGPSSEPGRTESRGDRDLGWLGLLGLAGLLGLRRKHHDHNVQEHRTASGTR